LLEILLVIGIIAILAGIVIVAINPSKQLATVRNTERKSDLKQLYNAITQYYIDNSAFPSTISTTTLNEVCNTGSVASTANVVNGASCGTLANLSVLVPTYLTAIPTDPTGTSSLLSFIPTAYAATTATGTGYKVGVNTAKQVLISAPLAELGVRVVVGNVPTTATACSATGGTISTTTGYKIHTFTTNDTFIVTSGCNVEVLVVAGGGGGGYSRGGGGGGGGLISTSSYAVTSQSYPVVVGSGGTGGTVGAYATKGGDSSFNGIIANGGGSGGKGPTTNSGGSTGGSGGGGGGWNSVGFAGTSGQGNAGGNGYDDGCACHCAAGGAGGGAGAVGNKTLGGIGLQYDISGTLIYYAGGGGGGRQTTSGNPSCTVGVGGLGGGGNSGMGGSLAATSGTNGLGGGGGGGGENTSTGAGGSGVVIVRYAI
jgi:type II secretory pathway pseudopilin PulG